MMAGKQLTDEIIAELSRNVAGGKMESIALGFLGADGDLVEALKDEHRGKSEPFNRDILKDWRNRNPDDNQVKVIKLLSKIELPGNLGLDNHHLTHGFYPVRLITDHVRSTRREVIVSLCLSVHT